MKPSALLAFHLALCPVLFSSATHRPFEPVKSALLLATALASGVLLIREPRWRRSAFRDPAALGAGFFVLSALISTAASLSPVTSLLGAWDSYAGLAAMLAYAVLFAAGWLLGDSGEDVRRILSATVLGATVVAAYAVVQLAGMDPVRWGEQAAFDGRVRAASTLGHPTHLATLLATTLPLAAWLAGRARGRALRRARTVWAVSVALGMVAVAGSLSRGGWLALGVAATTWCALSIERRPSRDTAVRLAAAAAALLLLASLAPPSRRLLEDVGRRVATAANFGPRRLIWDVAWHAFTDHPLLGCGLDAFELAFQPRRPPEYGVLEPGYTPNRAHNEALQVMATQGIPGLAALGILAAGLALAGGRAWRRADAEGRELTAALIAGLAGFGAASLFGFTVAATGSLAAVLAGILAARGAPPVQGDTASAAGPRVPDSGGFSAALASASVAILAVFLHVFRPSLADARAVVALLAVTLAAASCAWAALSLDRAALPAASRRPVPLARPAGLVAAAAIVAAMAAFVLVLCPLAASMAHRRGMDALPNDPSAAQVWFERAARIEPWRPQHRSAAGRAAQAAADGMHDPAGRRALLGRGRRALHEAIALVPIDAYNYADLGELLVRSVQVGDATAAEAFAAFDQSLARDPNNALFRLAASSAALTLGDAERGRREAEQAARLLPRSGPARAQLGLIAALGGRGEDARALLRESLDLEWTGQEHGQVVALSNLATVLLRLGRFEESEASARQALQREPRFPNARIALARALEAQRRPARRPAE